MHFKSLLMAMFAALIVGSAPAPGHAQSGEVVQFDDPMADGLLLDWCKRLGKQCGQPAADTFCRENGYRRSVRFVQLVDPGKPTRTITTGDVCDTPFCDSFLWIQCRK